MMTTDQTPGGALSAVDEVGTGPAGSGSGAGRHSAAPMPPVSDGGVYWTNVVGLGLIHLGALAGLVHLVRHPSLRTAVLAVTLYVVCGLSITAGYHRLFAHRTYRASAALRWCF